VEIFSFTLHFDVKTKKVYESNHLIYLELVQISNNSCVCSQNIGIILALISRENQEYQIPIN